MYDSVFVFENEFHIPLEVPEHKLLGIFRWEVKGMGGVVVGTVPVDTL